MGYQNSSPSSTGVPDFRRANYEGLRKYLGQVCQVRGCEVVAQKGMERSGLFLLCY